MSFQIHGLDSSQFDHLWNLSSVDLAQEGVMIESDGGPCRISMTEVPDGGEVLLLSYCHLSSNSPFRAQGPIYIQRGAESAQLAVNEVPESLTKRLLSLRAYDVDAMMVDAKVAEGIRTNEVVEDLFQNPKVEYLHVHYASRGCYACRVDRA
jgi:hypothetical protein